VALYGDDHHTTALRCPQALAMARQIGDPWATARATNVGCYVSLWTDPAGARAQLARSIEMARASGDRWGELDGLKMMTIAYQVEDDHEGAGPYLGELHATAQWLGNNFYLAWYHTCLALEALRRGHYEEARRQCELSLQLCETVGDPSTAGVTIAWLGEVEAATGRCDAARARYEAFLQRAAATGGDWGFPFAFVNLASLLTSCGEAATSTMLTGAAIGQAREEPDRPPLIFAWILAVHGAALLAGGEAAAAAVALAEADQIAAATHNPWLQAITAQCLGRLSRHQGDTSRAEEHHHHALALCHANHLPAGVIEALESLAGLAAHHESATEATRLLAAATTLRAGLGLVRLPDQQQRYDDDLAAARRQLDPDSFEQAWAEGAALSQDEAIAYATRARGQRRRPSSGWPSLTPTETEVVNLVAQGLTNPQIADQLFISRATVKTHLIHIFAKLEVTNRAQLAIQATRRTVSPKT
jgi:DNA-binding CsgD family transcriptional regulator